MFIHEDTAFHRGRLTVGGARRWPTARADVSIGRMLLCTNAYRRGFAVATLALIAFGCSDSESTGVLQGPGVMTSEQTANATEGQSTVASNSMIVESHASLQLNTYQRDGVVVRSLVYRATLDSLQVWFSLTPFPDGTIEVPMPDAAAGALWMDGTSWSFAKGVATVTQNGETWVVRILGTGIAEDQSTTELNIEVSGALERQCFVPDESGAPRAVSQDGEEPSADLVPDLDWSSPFCQSQR